MADTPKQPIAFALSVLVALEFALLILLYNENEYLKGQAVNHHYAEWIVDVAGRTTFKWKEPK